MNLPNTWLNIKVRRDRDINAGKTAERNRYGEDVEFQRTNVDSLTISAFRIDQLAEQDFFQAQGRTDRQTLLGFCDARQFVPNPSSTTGAFVPTDVRVGDRIVVLTGEWAGEEMRVETRYNPGGEDGHLEFRLTWQTGNN